MQLEGAFFKRVFGLWPRAFRSLTLSCKATFLILVLWNSFFDLKQRPRIFRDCTERPIHCELLPSLKLYDKNSSSATQIHWSPEASSSCTGHWETMCWFFQACTKYRETMCWIRGEGEMHYSSPAFFFFFLQSFSRFSPHVCFRTILRTGYGQNKQAHIILLPIRSNFPATMLLLLPPIILMHLPGIKNLEQRHSP